MPKMADKKSYGMLISLQAWNIVRLLLCFSIYIFLWVFTAVAIIYLSKSGGLVKLDQYLRDKDNVLMLSCIISSFAYGLVLFFIKNRREILRVVFPKQSL